MTISVKNFFHLDSSSDAIIYNKGSRPVLELPSSIAAVVNISQLEGKSPDESVTVAPGHELRKANRREIEAIKSVFKDYTTKDFAAWECRKIRKPQEKNAWTYTRLAEDKWRYYVIAFSGLNATIADIEQGLSIAPFELKIGFTLLKGFREKDDKHATLIFPPSRLFRYLRDVGDAMPFVNVSESDVATFQMLYTQIKSLNPSMANVKRAIEQILESRVLTESLSLALLGLFCRVGVNADSCAQEDRYD